MDVNNWAFRVVFHMIERPYQSYDDIIRKPDHSPTLNPEIESRHSARGDKRAARVVPRYQPRRQVTPTPRSLNFTPHTLDPKP